MTDPSLETLDKKGKCDTNGNGKTTGAEARKRGLELPVRKDHPACTYMTDRDRDGMACE